MNLETQNETNSRIAARHSRSRSIITADASLNQSNRAVLGESQRSIRGILARDRPVIDPNDVILSMGDEHDSNR